MNRRIFVLWSLLGALALVACDDSEVKQPDSGPAPDAVAADQATSTDSGAADAAQPDAGGSDDASAICGDPTQLAAEAMSSGTKVLNGVSLTTSTPIADILAAASTYEGQVVRIEGWINAICQTAGCYVTLQDKDGKGINLKVVDGALDFRILAKVGQYAVGEGVFTAAGGHGPQLDIMQHGAMIGTTICSI